MDLKTQSRAQYSMSPWLLYMTSLKTMIFFLLLILSRAPALLSLKTKVALMDSCVYSLNSEKSIRENLLYNHVLVDLFTGVLKCVKRTAALKCQSVIQYSYSNNNKKSRMNGRHIGNLGNNLKDNRPCFFEK